VVGWVSLLVLSAAAAAILEYAAVPAALLIGPMAVGIGVALCGAELRLPFPAFVLAQGVIGTLIAMSITPDVLDSFTHHWLLFLAIVLVTIVASSAIGWLLSRYGSLPGTTAGWGSSPGAASAMVVMAEAFGADFRLVAFMQYFRVLCVVVAASAIASFWLDAPQTGGQSAHWFPPLLWPDFAVTLAVAFGGALLASRLRIPAGGILLPMLVGSVLHGGSFVELQLPPWLLAVAYAVLGWTIGLRFTAKVIGYAARALPEIMLSNVILIAFCAGLSVALTAVIDVDPLTAYLATSPGGIDTVAIIAAGSNSVNLGVIMTIQAVRVFLVVLLGPPIARMLARHGKVHRPGE